MTGSARTAPGGLFQPPGAPAVAGPVAAAVGGSSPLRIISRWNVIALLGAGLAWLHGWMAGVAWGHNVVRPFVALAAIVGAIAISSWRHPIHRRMAAALVYCTCCTILMAYASSIAFFR
jgi:hypothetical protein